MKSDPQSVKEQAHRLIDQLPDNVSWGEVLYELAVRGAIDRGIADADAGRLKNIKDVRKEFEDRWKSGSRMSQEGN